MNFYINLAIKNPPFVINSLHRPYGDDDVAKADYLKNYLSKNTGGQGRATFISFDEAQATINITNYSTKPPFASWSLNTYRQVGYLHIQAIGLDIDDRYYFVTSIQDNGKDTLTYNCKLDYGTTYWNKNIINNTSYVKVLKTHTTRYIKDVKNNRLGYNFNVDSYLHNIDNMNYSGTLPLIQNNCILNLIGQNFFENNNYKTDANLYVYAILKGTQAKNVEGNFPLILEATGNKGMFQPYLITPLKNNVSFTDKNTILDVLSNGNTQEVIAVISSFFPLIDDKLGSDNMKDIKNYFPEKVPDGFDGYLVAPLDTVFLSGQKYIYLSDDYPHLEYKIETLKDTSGKVTFDNTFLRYIPLNDRGELPIDIGKFIYEPKLYTYPFLKCLFYSGKMSRELQGEKLSADESNIISFALLPLISGTNATVVYGIKNGFYKNAVDANSGAILGTNGLELPNTSSAYNNFLQNSREAYNTGLGGIGQKQNMGEITGGLGIGASLIGLIASIATMNPIGIGGSIMGLGASITGEVNTAVTAETQRQTMYSQVKDLQNQGEAVNAVTNSGFSNIGINRDLSIFPKLCFYELPEQKQEEIAWDYHRHGYIVNQMGNMKYDNFMPRQRGTFWQINNFMEKLNIQILPNVVVQYFNNIFEKGVTLGDTKTEMYNYNFMNGEKNML